MKTVRTFTDDQAIIRRFLVLAESGGDDWTGSGKLDDLLEDARCYLEHQNARPVRGGEVNAPRISLDEAFRAIREHAESRTFHVRMTGDDGEVPPVSDRLRDLAAEVLEIEHHSCDFGEDRDSMCGVCGIDPR